MPFQFTIRRSSQVKLPLLDFAIEPAVAQSIETGTLAPSTKAALIKKLDTFPDHAGVLLLVAAL